jgi:hypothetical protein
MIYQGKTLTPVGTARIQRPERKYLVKTYAIAWSSKEKNDDDQTLFENYG